MAARAGAYGSTSAVRVDLVLTSGIEAKDYAEVAKRERLKPIELELRRMEDVVKFLTSEIAYMRGREESMRNTSESTLERVQWLSMLSAVGTLTAGWVSMRSMKTWFQSKKLI